MAARDFHPLRGPAQGAKNLGMQVRMRGSAQQGVRDLLGVADPSAGSSRPSMARPSSPRGKDAASPKLRGDFLAGDAARARTPSKGNRPVSPRTQTKQSGAGKGIIINEIRKLSHARTSAEHRGSGGVVWSNIVAGMQRGVNPDAEDFFASIEAEKASGPWSNVDDFLKELHSTRGISESKEELLLRYNLGRSAGPQELAEQREEAQADIQKFIDDVFRKAWEVVDTAVERKRAQLEDEVRRAARQHYKKQADFVHRFISQQDRVRGDLEGTQEAIDNKTHMPLQRLDECHRALIAVCVESIVKGTFQDAMQGKQTLLHGWLRQLMSKERTSINENQESLISELTEARKEVSQLHSELDNARLSCENLEKDSARLHEVQQLARSSITQVMRASLRTGRSTTGKNVDKQWQNLLACIAHITDDDDGSGSGSGDDNHDEQKENALNEEEEQPVDYTSQAPTDQRQSVKPTAQVAGREIKGEEFAKKSSAAKFKRARTAPTFRLEAEEYRRSIQPSFQLEDLEEDAEKDAQKSASGTGGIAEEHLVDDRPGEENDAEADVQSLLLDSEKRPVASGQFCSHCGRSFEDMDHTFDSNTTCEDVGLGMSTMTSETPTIIDFTPDVQARPALPGTTAAALMAHAMKLYNGLGKPWQFCQCAELLRALESLGEQLDKEVEEEAIAVHSDDELPASVTLLAERLRVVRSEGLVLRSVCTGLVATVGKLFEIASTKATLQLRLGMIERQLYEIIVTCRPRLLQCFMKAREGWLRLEEPRLAARAAAARSDSIAKGAHNSSQSLLELAQQYNQRGRQTSLSDDLLNMSMSPFLSDTMGSASGLWWSSDTSGRRSPKLNKIDLGRFSSPSRAGCPSPEQAPGRGKDGHGMQGDFWDSSARVGRSTSRSHSADRSSPSSPQTSIPPRWRSAADYGRGNDPNLSPKPFLPYCSMLSSLGHGDSPAKLRTESAMRERQPSQSPDRGIENEIAKVRRQLFLPSAGSSTRATTAGCKEDAMASPPKLSMLPPTLPHPLRREAAVLPVSTRLRRLHVS